MNAITIFVAIYFSVFAAGFQARNINNNNYVAAALTSGVIAFFQLQLFKLLPNVTTHFEAIAYCTGGSFGVVSAMLLHKYFFTKKDKQT
jgi:uncharacterized membrane protein YuzA (DUF378 family)